MATGTTSGRAAIESEISRQWLDALSSFADVRDRADEVAASIKRSGRLILLGMGASHGLNRAVEPVYRALHVDAVALPISEQLDQPLSIADRTIIVTSQSGESAEVIRWLNEVGPAAEAFGLTMAPDSTLARSLPSLIGAGGVETAFAATRSILVCLALHAAILSALGTAPTTFVRALRSPKEPDISNAVIALAGVRAVVTSGRRLQGLAEALALGLTELSRLPCFSLECGQLRHGPMEMLGPEVGMIFLRGDDPTSDLVRNLAEAVAATGAPTVVLDASGRTPVKGAITIDAGRHDGLAALAILLPIAQRLMIEFAAVRVNDLGCPIRSQKITRTE